MRAKLRAAMVLAVAPHKPLRSSSPSMPPLGSGRRQGPHGAIFATNPLNTDVAGLHFYRSVKNRFNAQILGAPDHLLAGDINRRSYWIGKFFVLDCFYAFCICNFRHTRFLLIIFLMIKSC